MRSEPMMNKLYNPSPVHVEAGDSDASVIRFRVLDRQSFPPFWGYTSLKCLSLVRRNDHVSCNLHTMTDLD